MNELTIKKPSEYNLLNLETPETISTIKNTICKGASEDQLKAFMMLAKCYNLNPFNKEIYFSSQIGVFVGRHGKLRIANRHPDYKGINSQEIRESDDFEFDAAQNKITKHTTGKGRGKIIGAWATGKRKGFDDVTVICWLDEYKKTNPAWGQYTQDMIKYKAEDRVLRTLFNSEFEGIPTIDPEIEFIENNRPTFEQSMSPAVKSITVDEYLEDNDVIPFVTAEQVRDFWIRASELKLTKSAVKNMLISKGFIKESIKELTQNNYPDAFRSLNGKVNEEYALIQPKVEKFEEIEKNELSEDKAEILHKILDNHEGVEFELRKKYEIDTIEDLPANKFFTFKKEAEKAVKEWDAKIEAKQGSLLN